MLGGLFWKPGHVTSIQICLVQGTRRGVAGVSSGRDAPPCGGPANSTPRYKDRFLRVLQAGGGSPSRRGCHLEVRG